MTERFGDFCYVSKCRPLIRNAADVLQQFKTPCLTFANRTAVLRTIGGTNSDGKTIGLTLIGLIIS